MIWVVDVKQLTRAEAMHEGLVAPARHIEVLSSEPFSESVTVPYDIGITHEAHRVLRIREGDFGLVLAERDELQLLWEEKRRQVEEVRAELMNAHIRISNMSAELTRQREILDAHGDWRREMSQSWWLRLRFLFAGREVSV